MLYNNSSLVGLISNRIHIIGYGHTWAIVKTHIKQYLIWLHLAQASLTPSGCDQVPYLSRPIQPLKPLRLLDLLEYSPSPDSNLGPGPYQLDRTLRLEA